MDRNAFNKTQRAIRAQLKAKGICVDCRDQPVKPREAGKPAHSCCATCLDARSNRWKASTKVQSLPLKGSLHL